MRVQFPLRTLLLFVVLVAVLVVIGKWLVGLGGSTALAVLVAFGVGLGVGVAVFLIHQSYSGTTPLVNPVLVILVATGAWWFASHFASYLVGVTLGTIAVSQGATMLSYFFELLGLTIVTDGDSDDSADE